MNLNRFLWVALTLAATTAPAGADTIQWRSDYQAALQEAQALQRPLFADFGTANCFWCTRLEADTFRDPVVIRTLNERFVPVKVDADRQPALAQALAIESYPTLVFVNPRGQLLGKHVGYVDAARLRQQLQRALSESGPAAASPPAVVTRITAPPQHPDLPPAAAVDADLAASERLAQELCDLYLKLAADARGQGRHADAERFLERVELLGDTRQVQLARQGLAQVRSALTAGVAAPKIRTASPQ